MPRRAKDGAISPRLGNRYSRFPLSHRPCAYEVWGTPQKVQRPERSQVAQALDLAGAKNIVGAPSFAHFAKGGNLERMRDRVAQPQKLCRQHRYPPLQKTHDGAPSAPMATQTSSKDGPTRQAFGISRATVVVSVLQPTTKTKHAIAV